MTYVDLQFPPRIAMGAQRRPGWKTSVVAVASGREDTDQVWSKARHRYDVGLAVRTVDDYETVQDHFHTMRGRAKSFPFKDAVDYRVEASRGVLSTDGGSPTEYQLGKAYGTGGDRYVRAITRPRSGYVTIYRTRGGVTTDISSSCSVSYTTGIVVVTAAGAVIGGDTLSWSGQFWVPCRYDTDELPTIVVDRNPGGGALLVRCDSIPIVEVRE